MRCVDSIMEMGTLCDHFGGGGEYGRDWNIKKVSSPTANGNDQWQRLITSNYLANLTQYFVARAMIHFGTGWSRSWSTSQSIMPTVAIRQVQIESVVAVMGNAEGVHGLDYIMPPGCQSESRESASVRYGTVRSAQGQFLVNRWVRNRTTHRAPTTAVAVDSCDHKTAFRLGNPPKGKLRT